MKKLLSLALFSNTLKTIKMDILNGNKDDFHCYHVNKGEYLDRFINQLDIFTQNLQQTIEECKNQKMKAIWIQLDNNQLELAQKLIDQGFQMHHCTEQYLLFSQWLLDEKNRLPNYTTHSVGAGGVIIQNNKLLLVQEKNGNKKGMWCVPGGLVDDNELIIEAATREVQEETGLITEPYDCLYVRDLPIANEYNGDIYFAILMKLKNENQQIKIQEQEIMNHKWVDLSELSDFLKNNKFGVAQQRLMETIIEYNKSNRQQLCSIDNKPRMMYGKLKKYCLFKPNL